MSVIYVGKPSSENQISQYITERTQVKNPINVMNVEKPLGVAQALQYIKEYIKEKLS